MRKIEAPISVVCFDYYMTLVEMGRPFDRIRSWLDSYINTNLPQMNFEKFYGKFTRNRAVLSSDGVFRLGIDVLCDSLKKTCETLSVSDFAQDFGHFAEELFMEPRAYSDAKEVISALKGHFQVGLLTNADNYILNQSILRQGFEFDFVVTSEDSKANKPNKKIFLYALKRLNKSPNEILMVGDSQIDDICGAGNLGISTVWVNRNGEELKNGAKSPDFLVRNLSEILNLLNVEV